MFFGTKVIGKIKRCAEFNKCFIFVEKNLTKEMMLSNAVGVENCNYCIVNILFFNIYEQMERIIYRVLNNQIFQ